MVSFSTWTAVSVQNNFQSSEKQMVCINFAMPRRTFWDTATRIYYMSIICCSHYPCTDNTGDSFSFWNSSHIYLNHYQPLCYKHISNNNGIYCFSAQWFKHVNSSLPCKLLYSQIISCRWWWLICKELYKLQ